MNKCKPSTESIIDGVVPPETKMQNSSVTPEGLDFDQFFEKHPVQIITVDEDTLRAELGLNTNTNKKEVFNGE